MQTPRSQLNLFLSLIQVESLRKAVQSIGYDLLIDESASNDDTVENIQKEKFIKLKKKTYWALALSYSSCRDVLYGYAFC